jgi:hypothetical protein
MLWRPKKKPKPAPTMVCAVCGGTMHLHNTLPRVEHVPELRTFKCGACGVFKTVEFDPPKPILKKLARRP